MTHELDNVSSDDFRSGLADYLEQVRWNGHRFQITRRGTPYAAVISVTDYEFFTESVEELIELRKSLAERNEIMQNE